MDLELENNNMICAVKEIYTKFVQDKSSANVSGSASRLSSGTSSST